MVQQIMVHYDPKTRQLICEGDWDLAHLPAIENAIQQITPPKETIIINGEKITRMDSAGAWLLNHWQQKNSLQVKWEGFSKAHQTLLSLTAKSMQAEEKPEPPKPLSWVPKIGKLSYEQWLEFQTYLAFVGKLSIEGLRIFKNPRHIRLNSIVAIIYSTGYLALPIIALLSLMIGVVITYQMGLQLRNYGANIYIVDLLGISILREFGPLLTAIMIAGRTGSAFTAQLGMMKINQEIDALDTMGVTPAELLLLPRIVGLFIALPLLTMWANIFGVVGGMVTASNMLGISWYDFLHRFPNVVPLKSLLIGIGKAPIFALIIASVGCFQGIQVEGSADSVGRNTTRSVVLAIFFIIVADAIFSVIFSELKL